MSASGSGAAAHVLHVAEPSAAYLVRRPLVADCSIVAASVFQEPAQPLAEQRLAGFELHAPYFLQAEIASVAAKKSRQGFSAEVAAGLSRLERWAVHLHRIQESGVVALALRYNLSAYDAAYLWLAADLKCPLATFDDRLAEAARAHLATLE